MSLRKSIVQGVALAASVMLLGGIGAPEAEGNIALVGTWSCAGESGGMSYTSHFDYLADGRYISRQRISAGPGDFIEGGGGGTWRLEGDILYDVKTDGRLDRFMRNGVEVPSTDPEFQQLSAGSRANLGARTQAQVTINGDHMVAGIYTCERQR